MVDYIKRYVISLMKLSMKFNFKNRSRIVRSKFDLNFANSYLEKYLLKGILLLWLKNVKNIIEE